MGKTRATLADVSKLAGVSSATVSRVINGTGPVSEDVRSRIETAIADLGYEPRRPAPAGDEGGTIAVLTGDLINPYFAETLRGVQEEIDNYGMLLTLYSLTDYLQQQRQLILNLNRQKLDGIIVMGSRPFPALLEWQQKQQVPMIVLNRSLDLPGVHCISVDIENAFYRATVHLLNLNHERIGYISSYETTEIAEARRRGIEQALTEAGLSLRPESFATVPPGTEADSGFQGMSILLNHPPKQRPTAVLAFNDVIAMGGLHAARVNGVRVPQDMSVVGADDIYMASYANPPLTTIGQPKRRMGGLAVQRLRSMRCNTLTHASSTTILESPLIVRESTGPAPAGA